MDERECVAEAFDVDPVVGDAARGGPVETGRTDGWPRLVFRRRHLDGEMTVKLAEALLLRADRRRTFEQLRNRAQAAARYQEGEEPPEDANALLVEAEEALDDLETLIRRINNTNSVTTLADGRTLTAALAERDVLLLRHALLSGLADAGAGTAQGRLGRQMRSELRVLTAVPVAELRDRAHAVAQQHRELDALIQQANWSAELAED